VTRCIFCNQEGFQLIRENELVFSIADGFPISPGHTLVIPKRHVNSLFETTPDEREALYSLLAEMRKKLQAERNPDGFNIGINEGRAAGQTVMHLHLHLVPRYSGDVEDPEGGVRGIIPSKQKPQSR